MKNFLIKLHILFYFVFDAIYTWKKEIWERNLNENYCCNGEMCGCQGISVLENWYRVFKNKRIWIRKRKANENPCNKK